MSAPVPTGPLDGVRVLELGSFIAGADVERWSLALNRRGAQLAVAAGMDRLQ